MKGRNELRLSEASMIEIVQQWLDEEMPNDTPNVLGVSVADGGFKVLLGDEEKKP